MFVFDRDSSYPQSVAHLWFRTLFPCCIQHHFKESTVSRSWVCAIELIQVRCWVHLCWSVRPAQLCTCFVPRAPWASKNEKELEINSLKDLVLQRNSDLSSLRRRCWTVRKYFQGYLHSTVDGSRLLFAEHQEFVRPNLLKLVPFAGRWTNGWNWSLEKAWGQQYSAWQAWKETWTSGHCTNWLLICLFRSLQVN